MASDQSDSQATYRLRKTKRRYMIDKLMPSDGFPAGWLEKVGSFGPFKTPATAREFMLRHGGRP